MWNWNGNGERKEGGKEKKKERKKEMADAMSVNIRKVQIKPMDIVYPCSLSQRQRIF